ncbi:C2H2 type zinc finger domain-containing protein [Moelleriella libera RCEF 2490]|uniref:C2H2 type zinc finger domain-containing protein n=1 Tax=Moelleriella libera RCEF 2490 TaxID=1081109 RepID=A0A162IWB5_9HYPO|nr:C2H2 type zinc finger domain-containing protein [Moelleriella libera RCEF 2490]
MTTAAGQHHQALIGTAGDTFDPDDVVPRDSPLMTALHPRLELAASPPPDIPPAQVSFDPLPIDDLPWSNRPKIRAISGDSVLVTYLGNGRQPEIARAAAESALPGVDEEDEESVLIDVSLDRTVGLSSPSKVQSCNIATSDDGALSNPCLQHFAVDALQAVPKDFSQAPALQYTPDISLPAHQLFACEESFQGDKSHSPARDSKKAEAAERTIECTVTMLTPSNSGLPPLQMDSPKSKVMSQELPAIRSMLGDISSIPSEPPTPADKEIPASSGALGSGVTFSRCHPSMPKPQVSPPHSPSETHQLSLPSPRSLPASSPYARYPPSGELPRASTEYVKSASSETPTTEQSVPTPATTASVADRMSIDGLTNPSSGLYVCRVPGCSAQPFQTQYLLNSHANVHSSARPHFCPVQGCPRSEGGKGFKRKNEMVRHGLVHESPGYVCPFCPDREHKYPRPDNLQR